MARMVTASRRAGRVTNKTKLLVVRGSEKVDLGAAETIVWDEGSASSEATKNQHVGAKGVESGELLEHHLQAALSSASLLHSRPAKPSSPTSGHQRQPSKPEDAATTANSTLNYHIPTPDATGLVQNTDYAKLYQTVQYHEPHGYIRFSDTVEESSGGLGGLGYCMDDADHKWLTGFNSKAEGGSGDFGSAATPTQSPLRESKADNSMGPPSSAGRPSRGSKGKEKEKDDKGQPQPVFITEDTFEFIMGVLEKYAEDSLPMLHTNLALLPTFQAVEHLFSSPIPASFLPNFEVPKNLPPVKDLTRMARSVYNHWKDRRTERKGRTVAPTLNYDETNDGDPYVCFRRRDIRATRKTRRTDNFSVERMQKLQFEMRTAHMMAAMVLRREVEKLALFKSDKEVWEAKWKLYETKRRWPSLGMTKEEEELITGRQSREAALTMAGTVNASMLGGREALVPQRDNIPAIRKKLPEKEKEERDRRERHALDSARIAERTIGGVSGGRSNAPEALKERMLVLKQRLEEELAKRKAADAEWDDALDSSYQPLPQSQSQHAFRPLTSLDPQCAFDFSRDRDDMNEELPLQPASFRLRRGRGGIVRLDRRLPTFPNRRCPSSRASTDLPDWMFPDQISTKPSRPRPRSIDEVEKEEDGDEAMDGEDASEESAKRRRLNEICRYNVDSGGGVGVGMGMTADDDRVIIDDLDVKYIRHRVNLLHDEDVDKMRPDMSAFVQAFQSLDAPIEMPPTPVFVRPQIQQPNPQIVQMQQQQMLQQQQIEHFQRYQIMAQQQAIAAQQQAAMQAQAQAQQAQAQAQQGQGHVANGAAGSPAMNGANGNLQLPANTNGRPAVIKRPSSQNGGSMPPPSQPRPSQSPTNPIHQSLNGQSPQMVNAMLQAQAQAHANGKAGNFNPQQPIDPAMQQRLLAARNFVAQQQAAAAQHAQQQQNGHGGVNGMTGSDGQGLQATNESHIELAKSAVAAGFGNNIQGFLEAKNKAKLLAMAKQASVQQAAQVAAQQQNGAQNGNPQQAGGQQGNFSPSLPSGQLQLKLPPHAAARLGAAQQPPSQRAS